MLRSVVANLPTDIQSCILESKAMFRAVDLWFKYFKKLVTDLNSFSINFRNIPFPKIRDLMFFNSVIFFIYDNRRTTNPGAGRGVGSPQLIHTILGSTLNYHVFLTTVAFCNTYPNQPYTSHALHTLSGSNGPYSSVLGIPLRLGWRQRR